MNSKGSKSFSSSSPEKFGGVCMELSGDWFLEGDIYSCDCELGGSLIEFGDI